MPPKFKFSKSEIIDAALEITKQSGLKSLTARSLAKSLNCSAKPIFVQFENMKEVEAEVLKAANDLYQSYLKTDMSEQKYPPYKASGMAYIRFAREQKELFKILFMRDRSEETITDSREDIQEILDIIKVNLGLDDDSAYLFHLELWLYVHGIATMIATSYLNWDTEFISRALSDAYTGLKLRFTKED